ncbi:2-methoxy-6-polyprenyl-1,4-benzoquinol methylase, mitochondrial isoform X2 [Erinaceus europaeus]|uniref:2-methoxy-6-polyprenyl-1,4-benzoquinol methylase, mitochondrial n=1 Tax=Erinaceus europaeus TaxID=9365 RepID=A0A1S2ZVQ9_ERIEU|nr:2-methoxy-6-polyprenyl-1,4-benzoquinol methylase, mitochondrial isoform X2 [Erinaceus europaeus]
MAAPRSCALCRYWGRCWSPTPRCCTVPGLRFSWRENPLGVRFMSQEQRTKETHFGFETVSEEEKGGKVYQVFESVAKKYDVMNDMMSLGIHRIWKDLLLWKMHPFPGTQLLDVAGGTGIAWVLGDAEELPFDDDKFDIYTIAFGIRNVTHIDQALQEAYRVLKPGGRFLCLEFSRVNNPLISRLYDLYSFQVIPVLGEVIAGDWKSYQYLVESIRQFPPQEEFKEIIEDAGFQKVTYESLTSGIVAIHSGFKL